MRDHSFPSENNPPNQSPFDSIRKLDKQGNEYWSAKELAPLLGYSSWQNFETAIEKAKIACQKSGNDLTQCFNAVIKTSPMPKGGVKESKDYHLSRLACYLIAQNGNPRKKEIAEAQLYFAVQTRRQELSDEQTRLTESKKRIRYREDIKHRNSSLQNVARDAGVISRKEFSEFQDEGYKGLYNGETENDIHKRKGLKPKEKVLDYMGSEELGSNIFRVTQAEAKIRRENTRDKDQANKAHYEMGKSVRRFIEEQGGTMPEDLPTPDKSYQQLKKEDKKEKERQMFLQQQPMLPVFDDAT
jgi:DNA-damage-inducible protein D